MRPKPLLICLAAGLALLCLFPKPTKAQDAAKAQDASTADRLINLDTPRLPARGGVNLEGDIRSFGGRERNTYGTIEADDALSSTLAVTVRGVVGNEKATPTDNGNFVRFGGGDAELLVKLRPAPGGRGAVTLGVELPHTPAAGSAHLTAQGLYQLAGGPDGSLFFGVKSAFLNHNTLVGVSGGTALRLDQNIQLIGDVTGLVAGNNTRRTSTGERERAVVWGGALRFTGLTSSNTLALDIGLTNGLGGTTGFSLTPCLDGSGAFYAALAYRP